MHLEIPGKRAFNTYYSGQKGSFSGSGAEPDLGPVAGRDYEPFMPTEDEAVIWPSDEEIEDEEDSEGPPAAAAIADLRLLFLASYRCSEHKARFYVMIAMCDGECLLRLASQNRESLSNKLLFIEYFLQLC
ncbi:hypothetical protein Q3G72_034514 [Acer saccharum]|nr:hypothetical protein Q3G72_034514 [Acer saccharum]